MILNTKFIGKGTIRVFPRKPRICPLARKTCSEGYFAYKDIKTSCEREYAHTGEDQEKCKYLIWLNLNSVNHPVWGFECHCPEKSVRFIKEE